jgi:hypothetical protein
MHAWKSLSMCLLTIGCARVAAAPRVATPAVARAIAEPSPAAPAGPEARGLVDRVVLSRLKRLGLDAPPPEPNELCRRLAIDILGRGPTDDERAVCTSRKLEDTVDAWLARPEADRVERRYWFDLAELSAAGQVWYVHLVDIDGLIGKLARDEIGYGEFATRFVMHPALYARHPGDDWIRAFYTMLLGRAARLDEVVALQPLAGVWSERTFVEGPLRAHFDTDEAPARREFGLDPCQCQRLPGGCASSALGKPVDFGTLPSCPKVAQDEQPMPIRYRWLGASYGDDAPTPMRLIDASAGLPRQCKGGKRALARCADFDPRTKKKALPLPLAPEDIQKRARGLGEALTARRDFWESEVDHELRRYLGWWQTTFVRPDSDLPELREVLTDELIRTGSVRALRRSILTSILYTMPSAARAGKAAPPWSSGPRKLLVAEPWLDTMAVAIGEKLGGCDYRGLSNDAYASYIDPLLVTQEKATITSPQRKKFEFEVEALKIGGCTTEHRPTEPSLGLAQAEREIAARLCGDGRGVVPRGGAKDLEQTAQHLVTRLLARPVEGEEVTRLANEMRECVAEGKKHGCATPDAAARWMCVRLATSAEFGTY